MTDPRPSSPTGDPAPSRGPARATAAVALALVLGVGLLYAPVVDFGFVSFDDPGYVVQNPMVNRGLTADGVAAAFGEVRMANWHPLTWLSHMLDVELFGLWPGGHHLTSVLLHAVNAVLLLLLVTALTGSLATAALVAALFAVHPLRVESVAWVSERKDVLAASFALLTLLAWTRWVAAPSAGRYALVVLGLALGLLAKPMLVTLPALLLLLDLWPLRRWTPGATGGLPLARLLAEKLPLFALSAASVIVTLLAQRAGAAVSPLAAVPLSLRVANAPLSVATYLRETLWPAGLCFYHPLPVPAGEGPDAELWLASALALLLLGALTAVAVRARARHPYLLMGWLWTLLMLAPVLGIVQVGSQARADRYTYLPLIGVTLAAVHGLVLLTGERPRLRAPLLGLAAVALVGFGVVTSRQVQTWRSSEQLYGHAVAVDPSAVAHHGLGMVREKHGERAAAREQYLAALALEPGFHAAWSALGDLAAAEGDLAGAREHFERALALQPDRFDALYGLASVEITEQDWPAAIRHLRAAVAARPRSPEAHNALGLALARAGDGAGAETSFREALRLRPDFEHAAKNLASLAAARKAPR